MNISNEIQQFDKLEIDFDKLEKITKLVFHTAWNLVNAEGRPELNVLD